MGLVLLVHAAVIFGAPWQKPDDIAVPVTLQLDIAANGEPAHARQQVDEQPSDAQVGEIMPVATPPSEQESAAAEAVVPQAAAEAKPAEQTSPSPNAETSPPPPEAQAMAPAEQVPADVDRQATVGVSSPAIPPEELHPDAPAQAQTPPREPSAEQPRQSPNSPAREIQREEQRKEEQAEKRKAQQAEKLKELAEERKRAAAAAPARVASRAGTETGRGETGSATGSVSAADYGRLVYAEIARHSHYPESAAPATGTVVLSFTIGSSGRVTSSSVVRSSGNGLLDGAARQTMSAVSLPAAPEADIAIPCRFISGRIRSPVLKSERSMKNGGCQFERSYENNPEFGGIISRCDGVFYLISAAAASEANRWRCDNIALA